MTFYWQHARDSLLTDPAIRIFQIACAHAGEDFNSAKTTIDDEYERIIGRSVQRHGGLFQTYVQAFQEAGWLVIEEGLIRITPAGEQARDLLGKVPDFMKAVPTC